MMRVMVRYKVKADKASENEGEGNPLAETAAFAAFKEFQSGIRDRCDEPPVAVELSEVGSYRVFGD